MKFFYSAAVQNWDAEFYVKVDDNVDLDLGNASSFMSLPCKAMFGPIRVSMMSLSDECIRSNRGDDWASRKPSWSRWCLHWVHEVWRCDFWRVCLFSTIFSSHNWDFRQLAKRFIINILILIFYGLFLCGIQGKSMVWAWVVEIWGRQIVSVIYLRSLLVYVKPSWPVLCVLSLFIWSI